MGLVFASLMWFSNETEIGKRLKILLGEIRRSRIFATNKKSMASDSSKAKVAAQEKHGQAIGTRDKIVNHNGKMNVASLEEPIFKNLIKLSEDYRAKLIISWQEDSDGSYQWLKEYAEKNHIAFANWYPAVESVCNGIPGIPLNNPHSGGHYRTWVNGQIARAYARQILSLEKFSQMAN